MRLGEVYEATWIDASCEASEVNRHDLPRLAKVKTYGELVAFDEDSVTIAGEVLDADRGRQVTFRATTTIPRGWGLKLRRLG